MSLSGRPVLVTGAAAVRLGNTTPRRDFTYVTDTARALWRGP